MAALRRETLTSRSGNLGWGGRSLMREFSGSQLRFLFGRETTVNSKARPRSMTRLRPQKITFAEMRSSGVRGLLIYCADYKCSHYIALSGDRWPSRLREMGDIRS